MTTEHAGVTVLGVGTVRVPTTEASVGVRIECREPQPGAALGAAGEVVTAVLAAVRAAGIPDEDVRTQSVSVTPNRVWANDAEEIRGYDAQQGLHIRVVRLDLLDRLVGELVAAGGTALQIEDVSLRGEPSAEAESRARQEAVQHAHEKASEYASLVGRVLGRAESISELSGTPHPPPRPRMMAAAATLESMPIAQGEDSSSVTVQVHWSFE